MADLKISQLSSATALSGTEVVPVVQGGATKKATIDQILAPASGKGINFAAAGGDTLTMYDEGTWTPTIIGTSSAGAGTYTTQTASYTRVGRQVTVTLSLAWSAHTGTGNMKISGLPFTSANDSNAYVAPVLAYDLALTALNTISCRLVANSSEIEFLETPVGGGPWQAVPMDTSVVILYITMVYFV